MQERRLSSIGYLRALDGLRGLAVLMVVGFHAFDWPRNGGAIGVGFFFVLSGFLITSLLLKEYDRESAISLSRFYIRRVLRLFPLLYAALAVVALSVPFIVSPADRAHDLSSLAYCAGYLGDFYGLFTRSAELSRSTAHLWSLAVEEQFYLLWPATLLLVVRRRGAAGLIPLIALGMVGAIAIRLVLLTAGKTIWTLPTTHADALLAGCGVAVLVGRGSLTRLIESRCLAWMGVGVLAVALMLATRIDRLAGGVGYILIEVAGVVLLLCALAPGGPVQSLLRARPLVYCGRISYGVYVIHNLVIVAVTRNLANGEGGWRWAVLSLAVTFGTAAASRRWFESYFLRIKDRRFGHTPPTGRPAVA